MGDQTVHLATQWLGIWPDPTLTLAENLRRRISKIRQAEVRLQRIAGAYGVPPAAALNLQMAIVQGTMLYASELTWNGGWGWRANIYQGATNRIGRATLGVFQSAPLGVFQSATLGVFQSAPLGIIAAENGHTLARHC